MEVSKSYEFLDQFPRKEQYQIDYIFSRNLLIIDLDDTKALLFFSLSVGKEKGSDSQDNSFFDKDSVSSKMKELEDLFDISKWGDSPQKELFQELQGTIIEYLDNFYLDSPKNEG